MEATEPSLGGISFLSRLHGWASDNVRNYEVRSKM